MALASGLELAGRPHLPPPRSQRRDSAGCWDSRGCVRYCDSVVTSGWGNTVAGDEGEVGVAAVSAWWAGGGGGCVGGVGGGVAVYAGAGVEAAGCGASAAAGGAGVAEVESWGLSGWRGVISGCLGRFGCRRRRWRGSRLMRSGCRVIGRGCWSRRSSCGSSGLAMGVRGRCPRPCPPAALVLTRMPAVLLLVRYRHLPGTPIGSRFRCGCRGGRGSRGRCAGR